MLRVPPSLSPYGFFVGEEGTTIGTGHGSIHSPQRDVEHDRNRPVAANAEDPRLYPLRKACVICTVPARVCVRPRAEAIANEPWVTLETQVSLHGNTRMRETIRSLPMM